jgi:hypothetical protein
VTTFKIDGNHRYNWTKNKWSAFVSETRPCTLRRNNTTNGCRSAAFSASSRSFDLNGEAKMAMTVKISAHRRTGCASSSPITTFVSIRSLTVVLIECLLQTCV